jgi:hypothetical protein
METSSTARRLGGVVEVRRLVRGRRLGRAALAAAVLLGTRGALAAGASIAVGNVTVAAGSSATVAVTFTGSGVSGLQNDLAFDAAKTPIAVNAGGKPDCSSAGAKSVSFSFLPRGCGGRSCTRVRAVVASLGSTSAIPSGSTVYTCRVSVPATAPPGSYSLTAPANSTSPRTASNGSGGALSLGASNGTVTVTPRCTGGCC